MTDALKESLVGSHFGVDEPLSSQVIVVSGDDVRDAQFAIEQMENETILNTGGQFVSIAAGGAGLNYLHVLEPSRIAFFDRDEESLNWLKFLLHLIRICPDRLSFITSLFSRSADAAPTNLEDAEDFLRKTGSKKIWQAVHDSLDDEALSDVHDKFGCLLMEAPPGTMILPFGRCAGLSVPELPNSNFIGLMQDPDMAYPENYRCLNFNEGWLADEKTYANTKNVLASTEITYYDTSLSHLPIADLTKDMEWTYVYVSNENGANPQEWMDTLVRWKVACIASFPLSRVVLMTAFDGVADVINDQLSKLDLNRSSRMNRLMAGRGAHFRAWYAARLRLRGNAICELVHDQSIGFSEIEREQIFFKEFGKTSATYDTVIMHRPLAMGVPADTLLECIEKSLAMKARVILFDHNPESEEFVTGQAILPEHAPMKDWWTLDEAMKNIKPILPDDAVIEAFHTGNFQDGDRNWFVVLDVQPIEWDMVFARRDLDDAVGELRSLHMKKFKVVILNQFAAKAFKEKDYDSVVLAALEAHFLAPADLDVTELYCWAMCYIGQPDLAAAAITLAARIHGEVTEEMKHLAAKFGFTLRSADPLEV